MPTARVLLPLVLGFALSAAACAQSDAPAQPAAKAPAAAAKAAPGVAKPGEGDPRTAIAAKLDVAVDAVRPSRIPGFYEVVTGADVLHVSADARYVFDGDLYDLDRRVNVSEEKRAEGRLATLKGVRDEDSIAFGPKNAKHTITVFTDIDCGYCRKMHQEIDGYNKLGIRVRYLAYPRSGPGSEAWQKAQSVWCAPNRQDAMTRAKNGEDMPVRNCKDSRVGRDYELGGELRLRGTPGIYTSRGDYIAGYLPPDRMLERLDSLQAGATSAAN